MTRVLLTGGTGFVGANLARRLAHDGYDVHLLARREHKTWRIADVLGSLALHQADLTDREGVEAVVRRVRPDWVFHLAAFGAYSWETDARRIAEINMLGAMNLVEACLSAGVARLVNTGSSSEYGYKDHAPAEQELPEPNSAYAVAKASATLYCTYMAQRHQMWLPTLRLYSVYGPYEEPGRLIPALITHGLDGTLPPLVHPLIARDYVYIDDVVDAYLLAAEHPHQTAGAIYNIGSGMQTTLAEAVAATRSLLAVDAEPQWGSMEPRQWDTNVWVANSQKAQAELGWRIRHSFTEGLAKTVEWFRRNPQLGAAYRTGHPSRS